jgi:hypothetical protein
MQQAIQSAAGVLQTVASHQPSAAVQSGISLCRRAVRLAESPVSAREGILGRMQNQNQIPQQEASPFRLPLEQPLGRR